MSLPPNFIHMPWFLVTTSLLLCAFLYDFSNSQTILDPVILVYPKWDFLKNSFPTFLKIQFNCICINVDKIRLLIYIPNEQATDPLKAHEEETLREIRLKKDHYSSWWRQIVGLEITTEYRCGRVKTNSTKCADRMFTVRMLWIRILMSKDSLHDYSRSS